METFIAQILTGGELILAGCVAGAMNAIAGGGTLVTFPTLIFSGLSSIPANATSTVALLPAALASAAGYRSHIRNVAGWLKVFAPVSVLGGLLGGILLVSTPERVFDWLVPFLLLFATVLFMLHGTISRFSGMRITEVYGSAPSRTRLAGGVLFQFVVAVYGGYFGAGIGILMLASLSMQGFEDVHQMNTLKVMLGFLINIVAAAYFVAIGLVHWQSAGIMTVGTVLGGFFGARLAQQVSQGTVRKAITGIGLLITAVMFYRQFS
jgi:uncharacterized membrane protein YfcA